MTLRVALAIAGSDPGGGAGLEQDLRVFAHRGVHGAAVATALTDQDSARVHAVEPTDPEFFARRLRRVLNDLRPDAIKIGMLGTSRHVRIVIDALEESGTQGRPVVLDPVLCSSSGADLLDAEGVELLRQHLLPHVTWITPNRAEASRLVGADRELPPEDLARRLSSQVAHVYLTEGDQSEPDIVEYVAIQGSVESRRAPRIPGVSPHGTGCALSAALAANLARGQDGREALEGSVDFVRAAILASRVKGSVAGARPLLVFPDATG